MSGVSGMSGVAANFAGAVVLTIKALDKLDITNFAGAVVLTIKALDKLDIIWSDIRQDRPPITWDAEQGGVGF